MKLSFDEICGLTFGAVSIENTESGICFYKCTKKQIDAWYAIHKALGERAEASTGIRLDLHTNSSFFSFSVPECDRIFEIYINGTAAYRIKTKELNGGSFTAELDNSNGKENRVTLMMPSHAPGVITSVELDDGASFKKHICDHKFLFIGDSITQGWNSGVDSLSYAQRVTRHFNAESIIHGVGGGFYDKTVLDKVPDYDPELIIIAFGCNDYDHCKYEEALRKNVTEFYALLAELYPTQKKVAISPIPRTKIPAPKNDLDIEKCNGIIKEIIKEFGITLIEGEKLISPDECNYADELHPNAVGFGVYAENLIPYLEKILKQ